jgi:hypothetical protein
MRSEMRSAFGQSGSAPLTGSSSFSRPSCASLTASAPTNIFVIEKIGNGVSAVAGAFVSRLARPEPPDQNSRPRTMIAPAIPVAPKPSR